MPEPIIVDVEDIQKPNTIDISVMANEDKENIVVEDSKIEKLILKTNDKTPEKVSELKKQNHQKQKELFKDTSKDVVVQVEKTIPNTIKENKIKVELSFEDLKLQEVIAQVQELKKSTNTISDAEINALLDQAQRDIELHNLYNESTKKVDATALLQSVESDLEQSFRERAFKAIKSGFNYVKSVVVGRDN